MSIESFYVGTYTENIKFGTGKILYGKGEGIYSCTLDLETGSLEKTGLTSDVINPSFLSYSRENECLYSVNELKEFEGRATGTVSAFSRDPGSGKLTFLNKMPTGGTDPCHLTVCGDERLLFVANFMSGSVAVFQLNEDGSLALQSDFVQHEGSGSDPQRQSGPHAHSVVFDQAKKRLYVPDLGTDTLAVYEVDTEKGTLTAKEELFCSVSPGAGPRLIEIDAKRKYIYLLNELDSTVAVFSFSGKKESRQSIQTVRLLPEDFTDLSTAAHIQLTLNGKFLYGSNRGHDSIAAFRVDKESGMLSSIGHFSSGGKIPRNFTIDPTGTFLIAANQDSDLLVVFRIEENTGALIPTSFSLSIPTPVCVMFAD